MHSLGPVSIAARAIWLARVSEITYNRARARVFGEVVPACSDAGIPFAVAQKKESSGFNTKNNPLSD